MYEAHLLRCKGHKAPSTEEIASKLFSCIELMNNLDKNEIEYRVRSFVNFGQIFIVLSVPDSNASWGVVGSNVVHKFVSKRKPPVCASFDDVVRSGKAWWGGCFGS